MKRLSPANRPQFVERLETRMMLSASVAAHAAAAVIQAGGRQIVAMQASQKPNAHKPVRHPASPFVAEPALEAYGPSGSVSASASSGVTNPTPIPGTLSPTQVQQAYGFSNILLPDGSPATGAGETIAIVDAFDDPNIQSDLHTFDEQYFGGVDPTFTKVNLGATATSSSPEQWELEESLDVEWAHAIAPQANILLVEASSNSNMLPAVDEAVALGANVVSMSWGAIEGSIDTTWNSHYAVPNVTFVASSGDAGSPGLYPAASPDVVGVGGTSLALDAGNNWSGEVGWFDSGGGISAYEPRPAIQPTTYSNGGTSGIALTNRGIPDVAYDGARESAMSVYDSFPHNFPTVFNGTETGWFAVAGTSAGAPQWAALVALADQGRAQAGLAPLGSADTLSALYANPQDFHDVVSGTSTGTPNYSAGRGYDLVTGLGTPQAPLVVSSLIGIAPAAAPTTPTGLAAVPADGQISVSWNASSGATSWNLYRSTDGVNYSLDATVPGTSLIDGGLTDNASYSYEISAVNAVGESALSAPVRATPQVPPSAPVLQSATPTSNSFAMTDFNYGVTLQWAASSGATGYEVLRSASSGGGYAVVASGVSGTSYTDTSVHAGRTFYYAVRAVSAGGTRSADSNQLSATTIPTQPTNLTATAGNASIALTWGASTGATSYNVLRSTTNGSGYKLIASGITATSFTDPKLAVGTTYYYVVQAVDAGGPSVNSNQASATAKHGK